jgi:hypothetical protein
MKSSTGRMGDPTALTPALSRKREREKCPLCPGIGGEGWGEGVAATGLLNMVANQVPRCLPPE